ncbi:MAG: hypothetical protein IIC78_12600 [Chloroflexi bacterium]|nr:hypothetical protein [Chloroflexota bacterium]
MRRQFSSFHPYIFSIYPVIAFLAHNQIHVSITSAIRPLLFSFVLGVFFFWASKKGKWNVHQASIFASLTILLFFSYGHATNYLLANGGEIGTRLLSKGIPALVWLGLALAGLWIIKKKRHFSTRISYFLNITALIALIIPLYQIVVAELYVILPRDTEETSIQVYEATNKQLPDIYWIILDAYTREDILRNHYDYDNSKFIDGLRTLGFYVASCSQSNYANTRLSLTSSLNLDYIEERYQFVAALPPWKNSTVIQNLSEAGYSIMAFDSGFALNPTLGADILIRQEKNSGSGSSFLGRVNEFEAAFINTTFATFLIQQTSRLTHDSSLDIEITQFFYHYEGINFILEEMKNLPLYDSPKFVMVHIISPHEPFIFTPSGEFVPDPEALTSKPGYSDQIAFLNSRILPALETIIKNSATPPIILLQGDHGAPGDNPVTRMPILYAYYSAEPNESFYPSISPVNSFRLIFNEIFNTSYPLLEDISYFRPDEVGKGSIVISNNCEQ